jgi:hypothetical protein
MKFQELTDNGAASPHYVGYKMCIYSNNGLITINDDFIKDVIMSPKYGASEEIIATLISLTDLSSQMLRKHITQCPTLNKNQKITSALTDNDETCNWAALMNLLEQEQINTLNDRLTARIAKGIT